jgi:hypothetical protein
MLDGMKQSLADLSSTLGVLWVNADTAQIFVGILKGVGDGATEAIRLAEVAIDGGRYPSLQRCADQGFVAGVHDEALGGAGSGRQWVGAVLEPFTLSFRHHSPSGSAVSTLLPPR